MQRTRQLWEVNTSHKQMVAILNGEGFEVNERQLAKVRKQNRLWMRESRKSKSKVLEEDGLGRSEEGFTQTDNDGSAAAAGQKRSREPQEKELEIPEEVIAKRQERQARLMAESEERFKSRTRRRRTRRWAGLPPDEGMGPRFPSELTLAEAIVELNVDKPQYRTIRQVFEQICLAHNVIKKTICGPDKWNEVKNELISKFPQLQTIFWGPGAGFLGQTRKPMALDVICMDVTKRLRTSGQHVSIADAKNTLGLTPEEGREVRAAFDAILRADFFTGKLDSTKEHWEELKDRWIQGSTRLRLALSLGQADPAFQSKVKAIESIARDVQKRNRDRQPKQVFPQEGVGRLPPSNASPTNQNPLSSALSASKPSKPMTVPKAPIQAHGPKAQQARLQGEALLKHLRETDSTHAAVAQLAGTSPMSTLASQALAQGTPSHIPSRDYTGMQIDPSLLEAASLPTEQHQQIDYGNDHLIFTQLQQANSSLSQRTPKPVYFRLSPTSLLRFPSAPKLWLDTLPADTHDVSDLRAMAIQKLGLEGVATVQRIEGLASGEAAERWEIGEDDELEAYLLHVGAGKATFVLEVA